MTCTPTSGARASRICSCPPGSWPARLLAATGRFWWRRLGTVRLKIWTASRRRYGTPCYGPPAGPDARGYVYGSGGQSTRNRRQTGSGLLVVLVLDAEVVLGLLLALLELAVVLAVGLALGELLRLVEALVGYVGVLAGEVLRFVHPVRHGSPFP